MLFVRYQELPGGEVFQKHLLPFSILFAIWVVIFFIAGLYEKHTLIFQKKLPSTILNVLVVNTFVAVIFFYFIPYFGITPKTNLFIYLVISFLIFLFWRIKGQKIIGARKRDNAILIGSGDEMKELKEEVNHNLWHSISFVSSIDLNDVDSLDFQEDVLKMVYSEEVSVIAVDLNNEKVGPILPHLYNLVFSKIRFVDMYKIYEDIFDKVPLSLVKHNWFLENISASTQKSYDAIKQIADILIALVVGSVSLIVYPFIYLAIKIEDGGPIFFIQDRVGQNNKIIKVIKFRSMSERSGDAEFFNAARERNGDAEFNEADERNGDNEKKVTRVGNFLRRTRMDELPQLWNVIKGDLSIIGPRPEIPSLVRHYEKEIPFYNVRHLIKPGLSGWAQIYHKEPPKFMPQIEETRGKLAFDLYYIKNRSLVLDLKISLKTLKVIFSTNGV